jgi:preprotein translocase subunit SecG
MNIVIFLLSTLLVLTCLFLVLLVLVQLPKKEAGAGMAFGAGMGDMILGAGSGNVLTKITKYAAAVFLGAALLLALAVAHRAHQEDSGVSRAMQAAASQPAPAPAAPAAPAGFQPLAPAPAAPPTATADTNAVSITNTLTVVPTNQPGN